MGIIRYNGDPHSTVKYVKANLKFIGNITSFEVYFKNENLPLMYRNVPDVYVYDGMRENQNHDYTLILRDDEAKKETWLSGANCGYGGSGPGATKEILQLLGVKFDYNRISEEKIIIESNLVVHHDLNVLVLRPRDVERPIEQKLLKVKMSFNSAAEKYNAKIALKQIGYVQPTRGEYDEVFESDELPYSTEQEWAEYATNNSLTLNRAYEKISDKSIKEIIEHIGFDYNAKFVIKKYEHVL